MQFKDYYDTLGVKRGAAAEDVKRAYRKLARKFHPDVSQEKNAEAKFKDVQEAYEVLKDPHKRASYDQLGRDYRPGQQFRPPPDWQHQFAGSAHRFTDANGFSDFFSTLFGGIGPQGSAAEEGGALDITLEEAYAGTRRRVSLNEGGRLRYVEVQVPPGILDGQALRIGAGSQRPPLLLRIKIRSHGVFTPDGKDVRVELPLAPWEAALGSKIAVPTLGGKVELTVPAGAQSGQRLRLRGRGMPGNPSGDQLVVLRIVAPPADTREAREAYERMKRDFQFDARAGWR